MTCGHICEGRELTRLNAVDIMSPNPITADVNDPLSDIIKTMLENNIIRLLFTAEGRLVGVIARYDILKAYIEPEFVTYM